MRYLFLTLLLSTQSAFSALTIFYPETRKVLTKEAKSFLSKTLEVRCEPAYKERFSYIIINEVIKNEIDQGLEFEYSSKVSIVVGSEIERIELSFEQIERDVEEKGFLLTSFQSNKSFYCK